MSSAAGIENGVRSIFEPSFESLDAAEILAYYQRRRSVKYFAVADEDEVRRDKIDAILENRFEFDRECHEVSGHGRWLCNPSADLEWLIQLHKFYYAVGLGMAFEETGDERYADKWVELTSSWIDTTPLDFLPSDVAGRRIRNWIHAHYYFIAERRPNAVTAEYYSRFLVSLWEQAVHLREHLSPARNHRTLELCALFWTAVVFPEFRGAEEWLAFAQQELLRNMETDLLSDGVQCELSTDYHHIVLRNYLGVRRLASLNDIAMPLRMDTLLRKALEFSMYCHTPAGETPALSDGDRGDFRYLLAQGYELYGSEEMLYVATQGQRGQAPARRAVVFPASGYVLIRSGWGEQRPYQDEHHLLFDCGPLGAGNHGHLDLLTFELAANGRSLIVDPGRYTYLEGEEANERALFRGTAAHNTVVVDGRNQTRYTFHNGRYRIRGPEPEHELRDFVSKEAFDLMHGAARSHEYPVVHERRIFFVRPEYWVICDQLRAREEHDYAVQFQLSHEAYGKATASRNDATLTVESPGLILAQAAKQGVSVNIEDRYVSPRYGVKQSAPLVKFCARSGNATFLTILYPYVGAHPALSVSALPGVPSGLLVCHEGFCDDITFPDAGGVVFVRCDGNGLTILRYTA